MTAYMGQKLHQSVDARHSCRLVTGNCWFVHHQTSGANQFVGEGRQSDGAAASDEGPAEIMLPRAAGWVQIKRQS